MRWGYLIPRIIILAIVWAFFAFGFDPLIRRGATSSLQSITGAKVDIADVTTGFFPPRVNVDQVALASVSKPGSNLVEFQTASFHLAGQPLMHRNYVVDEATITGVRFQTSRNDNGQLEIDEDSESSGPVVPEWLQDKVKNLGDEWLEQFTDQAKSQLDPNRLETYQVGNQLYVKWDRRFEEVNLAISTTKQRAERLQQQIKAAKQAEPVQQIQLYLQIAQDADILLKDSQAFVTTLKTNVPAEVRQDFVKLDQAQQNDRQMVASTIQNLKPDSGRITESLIGEEMYLQLQHLLSWVDTIQGYQEQLKAPAEPERSGGRSIEFPILNPTPKVLCRKLLMDGELMLGDFPTPFRAVLTDVTSDPKLHGKPAILQVQTAGVRPVHLVIRHDATSDIAVTDLSADFVDETEHVVAAGKPDAEQLTASLTNLHWKANVTLIEGQIDGRVEMRSDFGKSQFQTARPYAVSLASVAEQTLQSIHTVNAVIDLKGSALKPDVSMTSDLGSQVANGFQTAFQAQLPAMKQQALAMVTDYAVEQKKELSTKLGGRYSALIADHQQLMDSLNSVRSIAANFRKGQVDPNAVFRTVSDSGLLKQNDQKKADKYFGEASKVMDGFKNPNQAFENALPSLRNRLLDKLK
ncbi:MAG: TIGR03545 family protein [Fuerstiella sp.]